MNRIVFAFYFVVGFIVCMLGANPFLPPREGTLEDKASTVMYKISNVVRRVLDRRYTIEADDDGWVDGIPPWYDPEI